jgi:hypothetical protein
MGDVTDFAEDMGFNNSRRNFIYSSIFFLFIAVYHNQIQEFKIFDTVFDAPPWMTRDISICLLAFFWLRYWGHKNDRLLRNPDHTLKSHLDKMFLRNINIYHKNEGSLLPGLRHEYRNIQIYARNKVKRETNEHGVMVEYSCEVKSGVDWELDYKKIFVSQNDINNAKDQFRSTMEIRGPYFLDYYWPMIFGAIAIMLGIVAYAHGGFPAHPKVSVH